MKLKKALLWLNCLVLAGTIITTEVLADNSLEIHGYARTGFLSTAQGTGPDSTEDVDHDDNFDVGTAGTTHGGAKLTQYDGGILGQWGGTSTRYGFEADDYLNMSIKKKWNMEDGSWASFTTDFKYGDYHDLTVDKYYAEIGNLPTFSGALSNSVLWAGQRNDENSFNIHFLGVDVYAMNGKGIGLSNIAVADGELDLGLYTCDVYNNGTSKDLQYYVASTAYKINKNQFILNIGTIPGAEENRDGSESTRAANDKANSSFMAMYVRELSQLPGLGNGWGKFAYQFGTGLAGSHEHMGMVQSKVFEESANWYHRQYESASQHKFSGFFTKTAGNWSFAPSAQIAFMNDTFAEDSQIMWSTLGLSGYYNVNKNFSWAFDTNYQYFDGKDVVGAWGGDPEDISGGLFKVTAGPTWKLDTAQGVWARPEFRIFASAFAWDEDVSGQTQLNNYTEDEDDTNLLLVGAQAEIWF